MLLTDFDALTFDCYGTLIDWERGIAAALGPWSERHGLAPAEVIAAFSRHEPEQQRACPDARYPEVLAATLRGMAAELGAAASDDEARRFGASVPEWPAFPDSAGALAYLAGHYRLVIVSNVDRASFAASRERLGVEFDLVVTAEDVGSYKPAPAHLERTIAALDRLGVPRGRILHTAQSLYHDHVPAKRHGLASLWVNRAPAFGEAGAARVPDAPVEADWEVPSMAAMVALHREHAAGG